MGEIEKELLQYIRDFYDDGRMEPEFKKRNESPLNILTSEIMYAIKLAKTQKAVGPDDI